MANETKKTANVATETLNGNLVIVREAIIGKDGKQLMTKDGRPYFAYIVRGVIRGQEKKVDFAPKDKGGYEPLDILFDINDKAELIMTDEVMTDENGNKTPYVSYKVQVVDEDGEIWECGVKPQRDSDKALLKFLLIELGKQAKKTAA
ncbi:MAG: hypothetical protein HFK05_03600 [Clostridia bacterium]|nr:hypothetical protein [Clostridia bacterium]